MVKRVTLKDVARRAGVTAATVSYVINNKPGQTITPETRDRVLSAARELRYVPNAHARTLRSQSSPCIGVVIRKNLAVPRFSQVVCGIQTQLSARGSNILLLSGIEDATYGVSDYVAAFLARRVDGVIFIGEDNQGPDAASREFIEREHMPFVAYDCQRPSDSYSTIELDYRGGARLLTRRVLSRRPRRLLYVRPVADTPQERLREAGVRDACSASPDGGAPTELIVRQMPVTLENMDVWDARYSVGDTEDGLRLMDTFLDDAARFVGELGPGDAVISSWAGWTHYFRKMARSLHLVSAELANNGENRLAADYYTMLPNFDAGVACADELASLVGGAGPTARTLKLTKIIDATLG